MQQLVYPSTINGNLRAPASKSVAQRAIAIASLANGDSVIEYPGTCDDVASAIRVCRQLGARIREQGQSLVIGGGIQAPGQPLDCGESGLGIRMFSGVAATLRDEVVLTGTGSLLERPMHMIQATLTAVGVQCSTNGGKLPLTVRGPIRGGQATIDGSQSSQALTGLLIAAPLAGTDLMLQVSSLKSREYIDTTISVMASFGVKVMNQQYERFVIPSGQAYTPATFRVEGDWSGAAFLLVAGAIAGQVTVSNLAKGSTQPDRNILLALKAAGAYVRQDDQVVETVRRPLRGFEFDATHCPDLFPPLAALAANCEGTSTIHGAGRLRSKESDRAATIKDVFGKMGIRVSIQDDTMAITGGPLQQASIQSHGDHRIAMAGTLAALNADGPVLIEHAEAVNKSYPEFFHDMEAISKTKNPPMPPPGHAPLYRGC